MMQTAIDTESGINALADLIVAKINNPAPITTLTFAELYMLYFERHVKTRLKNWQNAHYFFKVHGARWAEIQIHEIKRRDVQEWVDQLGQNSPSSATRALNMLQAIINWGMRRDFIPQINNPCNGVEKFNIASRERFLSPSELIRFKASLEEEPNLLRDFFWISLLTGARRGNVLAMKFNEIDFDLATWTIPREKFKNGDSHIVPLSEQALSILERRHQTNQSSSNWVFPGRRPDCHLQEPKRAWQRVMERAGIPDCRCHDLRRTLASYMAMAGESPYVIAAMMGHKDVRSTAVYARLNLTPIRKAIEKVSNGWQEMLALPAPKIVIKKEIKQIELLPKNANMQISNTEQVIVEGKILTAIRTGGSTKKHFYKKIGSCFMVNSQEMERILTDMINRKLIERYRDDRGIWRYGFMQNTTNETTIGRIT